MKSVIKKIISFSLIFMSVFLVACGYYPSSEKADACRHVYKLAEISIEENEIARCGTFKCSKCEHEIQDTIEPEDVGMPVIDLNGSFEGISKENEIKVSMTYSSEDKNFDCDIKIKWQGASSLNYPKKNYNIKLYEKGTDYDKKYKVELVDGWGKENKYCLKANYIDYSHARNVVSAKLYGDVVHSRSFNDEVDALVNGGAIDGFPVVVFMNGDYQGLYTMNIPKDKWLFDMDDDDPEDSEETRQALLMADNWSSSTRLHEEIGDNLAAQMWELEFCSTEETEVGTSWVAESFNNMIRFINNNDGQAFKDGLSDYIDVDRTIDTILYTILIRGSDNAAKNILWVTYDGETWFPSMYDMDETWGLFWCGQLDPVHGVNTINHFKINELYSKMLDNYHSELTERYKELRKFVLSDERIMEEFSTFVGSIPTILYETESQKWTGIPRQDFNNLEQIETFIDTHIKGIDEYFA